MIQITQETKITTVANQTLPLMGTQPQNYVIVTEQPAGNQTGNEPVPLLSCSNNCPTDNQESEEHTTTTLTGDATISPLTITNPLFEKGLVGDEQTTEIDLPLTTTVVLKQKQDMLYVPQDFENNATVDALVDSGTYVSEIAQNDLDTLKQKSTKNILKIDNRSNFQMQVSNGQLEKPLATAKPKFKIGNNIFAEHSVLMKKFNRANERVALYEEQQCSHRDDTRPHTFPTLNDAS